MPNPTRCTKCDGNVTWMEFKKSFACTWCGLHYTSSGEQNPTETPPENDDPVNSETLRGLRGFKGEKGDTGETGKTGPKGPKGNKGAEGDPA